MSNFDNFQLLKNLRISIAIKDDIKLIKSMFKNIDKNIISQVVNYRVKNYNTNLLLALSRQNENVIRFLLDNNVHVNEKLHNGETYIITETKYGIYNNILLLIEYGADIYFKDDKGNDALYYAISLEKTAVGSKKDEYNKIIKKLKKKKRKYFYKLRKVLYNSNDKINNDCVKIISSFLH